MKATPAPAPGFDEEPNEELQDFKPLTADEARQLRRRMPLLSLGRVVALQAVVGLMVALAAWALTGRQNAGWSAAYGALAVALPAALFARGLARHAAAPGAAAALFGFFVWEFVKIVLTVALLIAAPWVVVELNWLALLAGLVLTLKTYWIALLAQPGFVKTDRQS